MSKLARRASAGLVMSTIVLCCGAGCQTGQFDGTARHDIQLTADRPVSRKWDMRLTGVDADGTVAVRWCERVHHLKPTDAPTSPLGPQVVSSDPVEQSAVVAIWNGESVRTYAVGPLSLSVPGTTPTPVDVLWSPLLAIGWVLRGGR